MQTKLKEGDRIKFTMPNGDVYGTLKKTNSYRKGFEVVIDEECRGNASCYFDCDSVKVYGGIFCGVCWVFVELSKPWGGVVSYKAELVTGS